MSPIIYGDDVQREMDILELSRIPSIIPWDIEEEL